MKFLRKTSSQSDATVDDQAAAWLARRDRGFSAHEQDEYLRWLREDHRHAPAMGHAEATLRRVLQLSNWRNELSAEPNPDLLAPSHRKSKWIWTASIAMATAAVVVIGIGRLSRPSPPSHAEIAEKRSYLHVNEQRQLADGSRVELKDGSELEVRYTASERRVRLNGGEAQFSVMKDPSRPFVVEAGGTAVRAIGTVFDVRREPGSVEVLVTEGKVRVGPAATEPGKIFQPLPPDKEPPTVAAGQRAIIETTDAAAPALISDLSSEEITQSLSWLAPQLQFDETPLSVAISEFNRRNRHQLILGDASLGSLPIGGAFRPDNIEGFVRILSLMLNIRAEQRGANETVLLRGK